MCRVETNSEIVARVREMRMKISFYKSRILAEIGGRFPCSGITQAANMDLKLRRETDDIKAIQKAFGSAEDLEGDSN